MIRVEAITQSRDASSDLVKLNAFFASICPGTSASVSAYVSLLDQLSRTSLEDEHGAGVAALCSWEGLVARKKKFARTKADTPVARTALKRRPFVLRLLVNSAVESRSVGGRKSSGIISQCFRNT